jgi:alpha-beta hydrolase superfamily lysophospholipase
MNGRLKWIAVGSLAAVLALFSGGLWFASNQLLFPTWRGATRDLSVCSPETAKYWGVGCGNLRSTHQFKFREVRLSSVNGYELPGWLIGTAENGKGRARGAIMLIPAGGSDRREETRFIQFFLGQNLDVLALDLGCQGEAPCPVPGMTYGQRESRDVLSAYLYLTEKYDKVYAMGSSVGAASILISLPEMPKLTAAIAENPMVSFQQLIKDAPESQSMPGSFVDLLIKVAMWRGQFDGLISPEHSLRLAKTTPVYFIHSRMDQVVSYTQTQELAELYAGPKTVWFPEKGSHAAIWDADHADYEKRLTDFLNGVH